MTDHDPDKDNPKGMSGNTLMANKSKTAPSSTPVSARALVPFTAALARLADTRLEKVPGGLKDPSRLKNKTSKCLDKDEEIPEIDGFRFKTLDEARAPMDVPQWFSPEVDPSIPNTDEEYRKYVRMLVHAFKDMTRAKDALGNAYRKRLTPGEGVYYQDWAIEACSWDIVGMAKDIHLNGFKVRIYDKAIIDSVSQTQDWTFGERIDWICEVLKTSKQIGVTLMKKEKTWTTIGAPHKLYGSTIVNCVSNAHRGQWIKAGRGNDQNHQNRPVRGRRTAAEMIASGDDDATDDPGATPGSQVMVQPREPAQKRQKRSTLGQNVKHAVPYRDDAMAVDSGVEASPIKTKTGAVNALPKHILAKSSDEQHPGADMDVAFSDVPPTKPVVAVPRQDVGKNSTEAGDFVAKDAELHGHVYKYASNEDAFSKDVFVEGAIGKNVSNDGGDGSSKDKTKKKTKDTGFVNYHCGTKGMDELGSDSSELSDAPDDLLSPGYASPTRSHKQKKLLDDPVSSEEYTKLRTELDELKAMQYETSKNLKTLREQGGFSTVEPEVRDATDMVGAHSLAAFRDGS